MPEVRFTALVARHELKSRARGHSPKTLAWYAGHLRDYEQWRISTGRPDEVPSEETIDEYVAYQRGRNLSDSTVLARYRAIRAVLLFAESRRLITREQNPTHDIKPPEIPRYRPRHVTPDEWRILYDSVIGDRWTDHRDRLIMYLLFFSGLRLGEICALEVTDINLARREVWVRRGKGAKQRMVPITPDIHPIFLAYLYARPSTAPELLLASIGHAYKAGGPLKPAGLRQVLRRRCDAAGTEQLSAHKWRHGFAMWLRNQGTDLSDIATAMGHSTTQVTEKYYAFTLPPAVHKAYSRALDRLKQQGDSQE